MKLALSVWGLLSTSSGARLPSYAQGDNGTEIVERDVAIIGGGSAGTYTAIRLEQMGKSVALIEKQDQLGGHTDTFLDSTTGQTFDYGVIILVNNTIVSNYFAYLDVPLRPFSGAVVENERILFADFARSAPIPMSEVDMSGFPMAIQSYVAQLQKYPYLSSGFHLPNPVPEELLIPFGQFCERYSLGAITPQLYYINSGVGNILAQPTLYIMKYFNLMQVTAGFQNGYVTEANRDMQALYDAALNRLGNGRQAFVSSTVISVTRRANGAEVLIQTPTGRKLIKALKLVMAIPPKVENLQPFFDATVEEAGLFTQFNNSYMWNGVISNTGFPNDASIRNLDPQAEFGIPAMPAMYGYAPAGFSGLHAAWYGSAHPLTEDEARAGMIESAINASYALGLRQNNTIVPKLLAFGDHSPYGLTVSVDAIRSGFYARLFGLQGKLNTWWTGAAWECHSSSSIWHYTETEILPALMASFNSTTG